MKDLSLMGESRKNKMTTINYLNIHEKITYQGAIPE